jgi:hypothetical protein
LSGDTSGVYNNPARRAAPLRSRALRKEVLMKRTIGLPSWIAVGLGAVAVTLGIVGVFVDFSGVADCHSCSPDYSSLIDVDRAWQYFPWAVPAVFLAAVAFAAYPGSRATRVGTGLGLAVALVTVFLGLLLEGLRAYVETRGELHHYVFGGGYWLEFTALLLSILVVATLIAMPKRTERRVGENMEVMFAQPLDYRITKDTLVYSGRDEEAIPLAKLHIGEVVKGYGRIADAIVIGLTGKARGYVASDDTELDIGTASGPKTGHADNR